MDDFPGAEKADGVCDFRNIPDYPEDIIISGTRFLLWGERKRTTYFMSKIPVNRDGDFLCTGDTSFYFYIVNCCFDEFPIQVFELCVWFQFVKGRVLCRLLCFFIYLQPR